MNLVVITSTLTKTRYKANSLSSLNEANVHSQRKVSMQNWFVNKAGAVYTFVYFENDNNNEFLNSIAAYGKKKPRKVVPTIFIAEKDANLFQNIINKGSKVILAVDLDATPEKTRMANIDYHLMINNHQSYITLKHIHKFHFDAFNRTIFRPVYRFISPLTGSNNCFKYGMYCLDIESKQPYKTEEYRKEALRQLCLWDKVKFHQKLEQNWWKYVLTYGEICFSKNKFKTLDECSDRVFIDSGIDQSIIREVKSCANQFSQPNQPVSYFEDMMKNERENEFISLPGIVLNKTIMRGYLTEKSILTGICDVFDQQPKACQPYQFKISIFQLIWRLRLWHYLVWVIAATVIISIIVGVCHLIMKALVKKEMEKDVKEFVSTYYKMNETDKTLGDVELRPSEFGG